MLIILVAVGHTSPRLLFGYTTTTRQIYNLNACQIVIKFPMSLYVTIVSNLFAPIFALVVHLKPELAKRN